MEKILLILTGVKLAQLYENTKKTESAYSKRMNCMVWYLNQLSIKLLSNKTLKKKNE